MTRAPAPLLLYGKNIDAGVAVARFYRALAFVLLSRRRRA